MKSPNICYHKIEHYLPLSVSFTNAFNKNITPCCKDPLDTHTHQSSSYQHDVRFLTFLRLQNDDDVCPLMVSSRNKTGTKKYWIFRTINVMVEQLKKEQTPTFSCLGMAKRHYDKWLYDDDPNWWFNRCKDECWKFFLNNHWPPDPPNGFFAIWLLS